MAVAQPLTREMEEYIRLSGETGKEKVCPLSATAFPLCPFSYFRCGSPSGLNVDQASRVSFLSQSVPCPSHPPPHKLRYTHLLSSPAYTHRGQREGKLQAKLN